jgi:hypothetical protein
MDTVSTSNIKYNSNDSRRRKNGIITTRIITSGMIIMRDDRIVRQTIKTGMMGTIKRFKYFFS